MMLGSVVWRDFGCRRGGVGEGSNRLSRDKSASGGPRKPIWLELAGRLFPDGGPWWTMVDHGGARFWPSQGRGRGGVKQIKVVVI